MVKELKVTGCVCPVTALCIVNRKILAGVGSQVQVFDDLTGHLEATFMGLHCTNIHGFRPGPLTGDGTALCVFGGKCMRIFLMKTPQQSESSYCFERCESAMEEFEDWIWDTVWLQDSQLKTVALALAHNVVLRCCWQSGIILQRVMCKEKCLLYCARFIGSCWSGLVLAAGTVFHQIVLWSVGAGLKEEKRAVGHRKDDVGDAASASRCEPVLHRLTGHQGVIFSVRYHETLQRICSVSDDRSIRIWQLHFPSATDADKSLTGSDMEHATFAPMLTLFGHSARVWDVVLLSDRFISVGEDACCVVWDYSGKVLQKCRGHKGRSIWSLASSENGSFVVTGGGDFSIRKWHLQTKEKAALTQCHLRIPEHIKVSADDFTRTLALWDNDTVLLMTNAGSLLCHRLSTDSWHTVLHDADFSSYSTLALSPCRTFLAVCSIAGFVRVITTSHGSDTLFVKEVKRKLHEGKVCGLAWLSDTHFVSTGLHGHCVVAVVNNDPAEETITVSPVAHLELPACRHRWVVAGCLLPGSVGVVCGDRSGSVHLYHLPHPSGLDADGSTCHPLQTFPKIHGKAGVTSVSYCSDTIFTAGRDGQYRRWVMKRGSLQLLSSSRVFKGFDWIDRILFTDDGLIILGFLSSKFLVWSQWQGERVLEVECGGGHRSWDFLLSHAGFHFLFLKAGQVVMVTGHQKVGQVILKSPLHGLKTCDMKHVVTYWDRKGVPVHVMCTASEDTTVSIGTLQSDKGSLCWNSRHILHGHLSSVRALAVVDCPWFSTEHTHQFHDRSQHGAEKQNERHPDIPHHSACSGNSSDKLLKAQTSMDTSRSSTQSQQCSKGKNKNHVVFSAGGRAQIQAWRLSVTWNDSHTLAHQTTLESNVPEDSIVDIEAPILALSAGTQSSESSMSGRSSTEYDEVSVPSNSFSEAFCRSEFNHPPSVQEQRDECLETNYEYLGGCFLGEARHKRSIKPWKTRYLKLDPETRIMDLAAIAASSLDPVLPAGIYLLAVAGSDGVLRLIMFDDDCREFTLLCQSLHHNGCVLQVHIHLIHMQRGVFPLLFSAATDGKIAIWDLRPVTQWLLAFVKYHGSLADCHGHFPATEAVDGHLEEKCETSDTEDCMEKLSDEEEENSSNEHPMNETVVRQVKEVRGLNKELSILMQKLLVAGSVESGSALSRGAIISNTTSHHNAGDICSWAPCQEIMTHQSGINSLHVKSFEDKVLLASGGDDNALTICQLSQASTLSTDKHCTSAVRQPLFSVDFITTKPSAHAAQITGVWILSAEQILTASIDQRVNVWRLTDKSHGFQLDLEHCRVIDVADISAIDVWKYRNTVYVGACGEGIAVLTLDK